MSRTVGIGTGGEIRCFCSKKPLLAIYGVDKSGRPLVHVKIWKQNRLYAELVIKGGEVSIKCRDCYRWYTIFINDKRPYRLVEVDSPEIENADTSLAG